MCEQVVLRGDGVVLRAVEAADLDLVLQILTDTTVARWWGLYDAGRVAQEYGPPDDETVAYLIEVDGEVAGLIQYSEELDRDYKHASVDIALLSGFQGRGVGPAAIRAVGRHLFEERGHHRLTIDPAAANRNAIKAYEGVGFREVGVMRQYERGADGVWHDGLLMEWVR